MPEELPGSCNFLAIRIIENEVLLGELWKRRIMFRISKFLLETFSCSCVFQSCSSIALPSGSELFALCLCSCVQVVAALFALHKCPPPQSHYFPPFPSILAFIFRAELSSTSLLRCSRAFLDILFFLRYLAEILHSLSRYLSNSLSFSYSISQPVLEFSFSLPWNSSIFREIQDLWNISKKGTISF